MVSNKFKNINKSKITEMSRDLLTRMKRLPEEKIADAIASEKPIDRLISHSIEGVYLFEGPVYRKYRAIIESIKSDPSFKDISYSKIEEEYKKLLIQLFQKEAISKIDVGEHIDAFLDMLKKTIEQITVLIPIQQLKLDGIPEVAIGNVKFMPFESIKERLGVLATDAKFQNMIFAVVTVKAERNYAYEKGLREVDHATNLLRIYLPLLYPKNKKNKKIGISETIFFKKHQLLHWERGGSRIPRPSGRG